MARSPSIKRFLHTSVNVAVRQLAVYRSASGMTWPCHESLVQSAIFNEYLERKLTTWARLEASVRYTAKEAVGKRKGRPFVGGRSHRGRFDVVTFYTQSEDPRFVVEVKHSRQIDSADRDVERIRKFSEYMRKEERMHEGGILLAYKCADQYSTLEKFFSNLAERCNADQSLTKICNARDGDKRPFLGAAALFIR